MSFTWSNCKNNSNWLKQWRKFIVSYDEFCGIPKGCGGSGLPCGNGIFITNIVENCQGMVIMESRLTCRQCDYCSNILQMYPHSPAPVVGCSHCFSSGTLFGKGCVYHLPYLLTRKVVYRGVVGAQEKFYIYFICLIMYLALLFIF